MSLKKFSFILFSWFLVVLSTPVWALSTPDNLEIQLSVLVDMEGTQSIDHIVNAEFSSLKGNSFSAGYTNKTHWFKVQITPNNALSLSDPIILEVHPTYLDQIWFYYQDNQGIWQEKRMGDHYPFAERDIAYRGFALKVPSSALNAPIYIRLKTTSSSVFNLHAWTSLQVFQQHNITEYTTLGIYYGILAILLLVNAGIVLLTKDKLFIVFLAYLFASTALTIGTNGFWSQFLFPNHPSINHYLVSLMNAPVFFIGGIFYERVMLITKQNNPVMYWLNRVYLFSSAMIVIAVVFGFFTFWMTIAMMIMMIMLLFWLARAFDIWRKKEASFWLLIAHIMTLLGGMMVSLSLNGMITGDFWFINGFQIGLLGTMLALQIVMIQHVSQIYQANLQSSARAEMAELQHRQQNSFLSMLTHELKTPLSIINMVLANPNASDRIKKHAMTSVQNICDIVDHCSESQRLNHQYEEMTFAPVDVISLIQQQLDHIVVSRAIDWHIETTDTNVISNDTYLRVMINNLLTNADKYAKPNTPISIHLYDTNDRLCFTIKNALEPQNFPDEKKLYDPYYRAPSAERVSGSGLGLFIVKSLVERLSGEIIYQRHEDYHISFTISLQKNKALHKKS